MADKLFSSDTEGIKKLVELNSNLRQEIAKVIVGQEAVITDVLVSIFSQGHCLLIGVPGLAKTLLVNTVAQVLSLTYNRIQFTPDLMPSDITGIEILDENRQFKFIKGPLFANIILADEINRTPPKTQSALLEAMQERAVTVSGKRYPLDDPFFVLATQNPIEQEGTYPLPEAQLDRFMFSIMLGYPELREEIEIVKSTTADYEPVLSKIISGKDIIEYQHLIKRIPVTDTVLHFAVKLASSSRPGTANASSDINNYIAWGAGPRASQYLITGAKAFAALNGKFSPDIDDVIAVAPAVLRHRIVKNYKAEAEGISIDEIIKRMLLKNN
ncbi:MAG: MoxR family ATPase [Bacteroidia bacterium]|nr:MoxR family ATPase [Bacteroidia bacterium]MCZ2277090.1 MoxR family ATPase [Bacteroidia bacterium]